MSTITELWAKDGWPQDDEVARLYLAAAFTTLDKGDHDGAAAHAMSAACAMLGRDDFTEAMLASSIDGISRALGVHRGEV